MDAETMKEMLEWFSKEINDNSDKKLDLIDAKLNNINHMLEETNINLEEVRNISKANGEEIKVLQEETNKNTEQTILNRNTINMQGMRIRELENELESRNNSDSSKLNQLYSTVGAIKAQISDLTSKTNNKLHDQEK